MAIGLSKCSVVIFLRQLFTHSNTRIWRTCTAFIVLLVLWPCGVTLSISINSSNQCVGQGATEAACQIRVESEMTRWKVVVGVDACLEAMLVILPATLFSTLQMRINRKVMVTSAFAFRLG